MKKNKITGLVGTFVLHAVVLLLLFFLAISKPKAQEEGGVPVMLGDMELAQGYSDPYMLTDVDVLDESGMITDTSVPEPEVSSEAEMITQDDEPTISVPKKEVAKNEAVEPKEKTEAEKRAEAERLAAEKKAAEERAAAEAAAKRIAGAFGKGIQMGNKTDSRRIFIARRCGKHRGDNAVLAEDHVRQTQIAQFLREKLCQIPLASRCGGCADAVGRGGIDFYIV